MTTRAQLRARRRRSLPVVLSTVIPAVNRTTPSSGPIWLFIALGVLAAIAAIVLGVREGLRDGALRGFGVMLACAGAFTVSVTWSLMLTVNGHM